MMTAEPQSDADDFVLDWNYVLKQTTDAARTFFSPVKSVREVGESVQAGRAAASEYVQSLADASEELTWRYLFKKFREWLWRLINGA